MTEIQHMLLANVIFLILWYLWLQPYFVSGKDVKKWKEIFKRYF